MVRTSLAIALALAGSACGNKQAGAPAATGSGSATAQAPAANPGSAAGSSTGSGAAAAPAAAKIDAVALDAAIAARGFDPKAVRQRAIGPHSAWALIRGPVDADKKIFEMSLLRVTGAGAEMLKLTPPARKYSAWWSKDVPPLDVRDLDGDGNADCLLVLEWMQDLPIGIGEDAKELYVISGSGPLKVAYTTIIDYTAGGDDGDGRKGLPPPEHIGFDWKVTGPPPVLSLERTENQVNAKRTPGLTDVATDPLMPTGAGNIPLSLN